MRVTEITHEDRGWSPLALHPHLSVVAGDADQLADVAQVLDNLYSSAGSVVGGTLEYSGFHMPLDQTAVVSLDIHGRGLRSLDVALLEQACASMRAELVAEVDSRLAGVDATTEQAASDADSLRRRCAAAEAATAAVTEELEASRGQLEDLTERLELAVRRPQELRSEANAAQAATELAEEALAAAEALVPSLLEALDVTGADALRALRLGADTRELAAAVTGAGAADLLDEDHAEALVGWLVEVSAGTAEPSQWITGMLEEIEALERRFQDLSARGVEGDQEVIEARTHHQEVNARTANLEELASSGLLAEQARCEIDAAHDSADETEEHRVLSLYGFDSHLDYTIALSTRSVGEAIQATVDRARAEAVRATDALEMAREQAAALRGECNERRDQLRERITAATGVDPESPSVEVLATVPEIPQTVRDVPAAVDAAVDSLRRGVVMAREALEECRSALDALVDPEVIRSEVGSLAARVAELEALLERAEEVHRQSATSLEETETSLRELHCERADLVAERATHVDERAVSDAGAGEPRGAHATEVAVVVRAATEQVLAAGAEPTPVLLRDSFASLGSAAPGVLEALVANAPGVQFVYLSEDDAILSWAKKLPAETASLVRVGRRRWLGRRLAWGQARQAQDNSRTV